MLRSVLGKITWMARATTTVVGLAIMLALVLGVASTAFGANGGSFILGKGNNVATRVTGLIGKVAGGSALAVKNPSGGSALGLQVAAGQAPLTVNADAGKATNLDADKLDGKDATQIGVNGLERARSNSANNSASYKTAIADCPSGKVVVGTGYDVFGGKTGSSPNQLTDVAVTTVAPTSTSVYVEANEEEATSNNWQVIAYALCAKAP